MKRMDGNYRVTVHVDHHLTAEDVAAILAQDVWGELSDYGRKEPDRLTQARAEKAVRSHLWLDGIDSLQYWRERIEGEHIDEAWAWACEQVRRLFPALGAHLDNNHP
jgi:hypothetical protein